MTFERSGFGFGLITQPKVVAELKFKNHHNPLIKLCQMIYFLLVMVKTKVDPEA